MPVAPGVGRIRSSVLLLAFLLAVLAAILVVGADPGSRTGQAFGQPGESPIAAGPGLAPTPTTPSPGQPAATPRSTATARPIATATPRPAPACSVAVGMYQTKAPWSWSEINSIESQISRHSAIVHWYAQWGNQSGVFVPTVINLLNGTRTHGSTPMITWEPWNTYPITNNPFPLSQIAAGNFDSYIDSWASGMASYGHPVLIAFAQEMNGNWYPWGDNVNGSTPAAYIAAWRHIHDRFATKGARNVQWVFDPDGDAQGSFPNLQLFYPGDSYVDWLAADVYNWGTTRSWSSWQDLSTLFRLAYSRLSALNSAKSMMLAEWASVEQGGSKAQWIQNAGAAIPSLFPRVRAVVWFSEDNTQVALTSSSAALAAARAVFGVAPYCLTLPY